MELNLSDNAKFVLSKRYLAKDENGNVVETFEDMFRRVAKAAASVEETDSDKEAFEKLFYETMVKGEFLPNSPALMNAGRPLGQLLACYVIPVGDSIEEIFDAVKHAAMIHKSGGGTGFSFSRIRPKNSSVGSTGGVASGPLSFIKVFNSATEQIKQGGTRRGANMGVLRVDHPDIIEFIRAKETDGELTNFNLSIGLTEEFMSAVERDTLYPIINPVTQESVEVKSAKEVFQLLVDKAWGSGEPGIIFLDRINEGNPVKKQGLIEATNPCGEQPLLPYEACDLGSINLSKFFDEQKLGYIDTERLEDTVRLAIRFLDNLLSVSKFPLPQIEETVKRNRKVGLGVMGWADLLYKMGVPYGSEVSLAIAERVMRLIHGTALQETRYLADLRGSFPAIEESDFAGDSRRNATLTTIAPTGTLSIIAGCSSGIEPLFALSMIKNIMDGTKMVELNPVFEKTLRDNGLWSEELKDRIGKVGSIKDMTDIPEDIRNVFVTAMDISPDAHVKMQAAFQKYTDNAVSKTVNLPSNATKQDVYDIYMLAYKLGCKGVTVYRDGCRQSQVLNVGKVNDGKPEVANEPTPFKRPDCVRGFTQKVPTGLGVMYLTVNEIDGKPVEVFATIGKSGHSVTAKVEAIGRLVSLALRSGIDVSRIIRQLKGIGGEHPMFRQGGMLMSVPDAVARVLEDHYGGSVVMETSDGLGNSSEKCPECGAELVMQEGCCHCSKCTYSKCG